MWFYALRGTGLYVHVGTTATFTTQAAAMRELLNETVPEWPLSKSQLVAMKNAAARAGLDTLQFTEHCDNRCGCIGTEIMFTKLNGTAVCNINFRNGLGGAHACHCDPNITFANCPNTVALIRSLPAPAQHATNAHPRRAFAVVCYRKRNTTGGNCGSVRFSIAYPRFGGECNTLSRSPIQHNFSKPTHLCDPR